MEYYWEIVRRDGTRVEVPPAAVDTIRTRWKNKEPIHLPTMSIPPSDIQDFRMTSKAFGHQPLLEAAAQAFDEPLINDDGSMICRWVKKQVTNREYNKHYAAVPAYRKLTEQNGLVTVAFFLPIHEADLDKVDYCEDSEVRKLQLTR